MHASGDLLSRLLAHWRSDRAVTARFALSAPWALRSDGVEGALIRMATDTSYWIAIGQDAPQRIEAGDILMLVDTEASLYRLFAALAISVAIGLILGIAIGLLPYMRAGLGAFVAVVSMVPPLALLPILFITMGLGEASKIALIVIGVAPVLIRDVALRVGDLPPQQMIKAQTLGASTWQIVLRMVLPQTLPRLIDSLRLQIGPAWLFLIAAEAIASESGLGYRIFLVRRYLAMDVILTYVAWITLLAFLMDRGLALLQRRAFPWFAAARATG